MTIYSESADASGATGLRLKEGGNINRSLVTLGTVIALLGNNEISFINKVHIFISCWPSVIYRKEDCTKQCGFNKVKFIDSLKMQENYLNKIQGIYIKV